MTMQQPFPDTLLPNVPEDVENEILKEIAQEWADEVYDEINDAYPGYVLSPSVELPPRERFVKYMQRIFEAYPNDEMSRQMELGLLLNVDYVDLYKQGLVPPPLSMPWAILIHVPRIFKDIQRDLRKCYLRWSKEAT